MERFKMDLNLNDEYSLNDYIEVQTIYEPHSEYSVTCASFDPQQELFWTGNVEGRISSYYTLSLQKYTSFCLDKDSEIKMILPHNNNLFCLTSNMFASYSRYGTKNFTHKEVSFQNLQCMHLNQQERFFLGGFSEHIFDFDVERLRVLRQLSISEEQTDCILIKHSSASTNLSHSISRNGILCTGSSSGQIILRDPFTLKLLNKFQPHSGSLSDFDVHGNYLVSCGFSLTRNGNLCVDRFLMVYDLRMMRALNPVQMIIEPCFLHYLPMCSSVVAVASQSACFQLTDTNLLNPSTFYQAQVPPIGGLATTFSMSGNCQAFAFGHSSGSIHLFSKGENETFNDFSEPTLIVEPPQITNPYIDIFNEIAPLSSVPVPLTDQALLSDWPLTTTPKFRPTPIINSEIIENSRIHMGIMSVPNRIDFKRNQINDASYQSYIDQFEKLANTTAFSLKEFDANLEKSNGEATKEDETKLNSDTPNINTSNLNVENDNPTNKT